MSKRQPYLDEHTYVTGRRRRGGFNITKEKLGVAVEEYLVRGGTITKEEFKEESGAPDQYGIGYREVGNSGGRTGPVYSIGTFD